MRNVGTTIETGGDLTLTSEGGQHYQKATLHSGANLTLDSGDAITFEAVKDLDQESHERSKSDWAWNSAKGKGTTDETLRQSQLIASGETIIRAVDGIRIDVKQVDRQTVSQTIDAMVAADPALAWIKEAEKRGDVDWRQVKELHDAWDYQSSGLGAGAALIIAIVVTVLTAGAASAALGAAFSSSATMAAATAGAAAGVGNIAATAAITSAASTTAVSTINNKGNLGKVFKDVTSANNLKNYVTAAVTAGVIAGVVDPALSVKTDPTNGTIKGFDLSTASGIAGMTQHAAASAVVQAGVGTAINGGSFSDNLQGALKNQLQSVLQAVAFNAVGDYSHDKWDDSSPQKVALHALVGGLLSKAAGNDFATGAAAAGANELLIKQLGALTNSNPDLLVAASQIVGVAVAGLTNGDAQTGADIAKSATSYNYLNHQQLVDAAKELKQCAENAACREAVNAKYQKTSLEQDLAAFQVCAGSQNKCTALSREIANAMANLEDAYAVLGDGPHPEWEQLRTSNLEFQQMLNPVTSTHQADGLADYLKQKWGLSEQQTTAIKDGLVLVAMGGTAAIAGATALKKAIASGKTASVAEGTKGNKNWQGSGPAPGVLGLEPGSISSKAIQNYFPSTKNGSVEFIFDPKTSTFAVGKPTSNLGGSPHQQLAKTIKADGANLVGGMFRRGPNGEVITNEFSGHYWKNWTPEIREKFEKALKEHNLDVKHNSGM